MLTLAQLAKRAGATQQSVLRKDVRDGLLVATLYGKMYLVEDDEAARWMRDVWPVHVANRKKPVGTKRRARR